MTEKSSANFLNHHVFNGIEGIILDMDGVIVETLVAHRQSWADWAREEELKLDLDSFMKESFGRGNFEIMGKFFPEFSHDREYLSKKGERKEELFLESVSAGKVNLLAGLREFLAECMELKMPVVVGSSAPKNNVEFILNHFQIGNLFHSYTSSHDVKHAKPDPEIFLKCAAKLNLSPGKCLVFEDSLYGLEAAKRAGSPAVAVATFHTPEELIGKGVFTIRTFNGLRD